MNPELKNLQRNAAAVLDGNFSDYSSAVKKIRQAHKAGKKFVRFFTYRPFLDALENGIISRMKSNPAEMERLVPNKISVENHIGSWDVSRQVEAKGVDGKGIETIYLRNETGTPPRVVTFDDLDAEIKYPDFKTLKKIADDKVKELYEKGVMTKEQYDQYIVD
jgi:hypothetical protein